MPWTNVGIEFLGLTELGVEGGPDIEMRCRITHPFGVRAFNAHPHFSWSLANVVEVDARQAPGVLDVRIQAPRG